MTYAILLCIGLVLIAIWAIAYYMGSRQMVTTISTAVSAFATYAVALLAVAAVASYLVGLFKWLYHATKGWSRVVATDILVGVAVPVAIVVGWAVWR